MHLTYSIFSKQCKYIEPLSKWQSLIESKYKSRFTTLTLVKRTHSICEAVSRRRRQDTASPPAVELLPQMIFCKICSTSTRISSVTSYTVWLWWPLPAVVITGPDSWCWNHGVLAGLAPRLSQRATMSTYHTLIICLHCHSILHFDSKVFIDFLIFTSHFVCLVLQKGNCFLSACVILPSLSLILVVYWGHVLVEIVLWVLKGFVVVVWVILVLWKHQNVAASSSQRLKLIKSHSLLSESVMSADGYRGYGDYKRLPLCCKVHQNAMW